MFGKKKVEVDPKEKIEATIESLEGFVRKADIKRRTLLEKAKLAKARGDNMSYNMAVGALRIVMQQSKRAEQMVLSMEIMQDYKDVNVMTTAFFESMKNVCSSMSEVPNLKKMSKISAEFNSSMQKMNKQTMIMDEYMNSMSENMSGMEFDGVSNNDDIGKMIDRELATELDADDIAIAKELEQAKLST